MRSNPIYLGKVEIIRNLAVAKLYADDCFNEEAILLEEALKKDNFSITETGTVEKLAIENNLDKKVFIASGSVIEGNSQNRMALYPALIPAQANIQDFLVRCVQERKGLTGGSRYSLSDTIVMPSLRGRDQRTTWDTITLTTQILEVGDVRGRDYSTILKMSDKSGELNDYLELFGQPEDRQIGYVAAIKNRNGIDCYTDFFGNQRFLKGLYNKLSRSVAFVARLNKPEDIQVDKDSLVSFIRSVPDLNKNRIPNVGEGELYQIEDKARGTALFKDNNYIQIFLQQNLN